MENSCNDINTISACPFDGTFAKRRDRSELRRLVLFAARGGEDQVGHLLRMRHQRKMAGALAW
jgi:hypothetical protein